MILKPNTQYRVTRDDNRSDKIHYTPNRYFCTGDIITTGDSITPDGDGEVYVTGATLVNGAEGGYVLVDALEPVNSESEGVDNVDLDLALRALGLNKYTPLNFAGWNAVNRLAEQIKEAREAL